VRPYVWHACSDIGGLSEYNTRPTAQTRLIPNVSGWG